MPDPEDRINTEIRKRISHFVNINGRHLETFDDFFNVEQKGNIYYIIPPKKKEPGNVRTHGLHNEIRGMSTDNRNNSTEEKTDKVELEEIMYQYLKYLSLLLYKKIKDPENELNAKEAGKSKRKFLSSNSFDGSFLQTIAKYGEALGPEEIRPQINYQIPKKYCDKKKPEFRLKNIFFKSAQEIIKHHKQTEPSDIVSVYEAIEAILEQVKMEGGIPNLDEKEEKISEKLQPILKVSKFLELDYFRQMLGKIVDFQEYRNRTTRRSGRWSKVILKKIGERLIDEEQRIYKEELCYDAPTSLLHDWKNMRERFEIDDELTEFSVLLKDLSKTKTDIVTFVENNENKNMYTGKIDEKKIYYNESFTKMVIFQETPSGKKRLYSISEVSYRDAGIAEAIATTTDTAVSRISDFFKQIRKAADGFKIIDRSEYEIIHKATMNGLANEVSLKTYLRRFFELYLNTFKYLRMQSADKVVHHIIKHPAVDLYAPIPNDDVAKENVERYFETVANWVKNTKEEKIYWTLDKTGSALIHFEGEHHLDIREQPKPYSVIVCCKPNGKNCEVTLLTALKIGDNTPIHPS